MLNCRTIQLQRSLLRASHRLISAQPLTNDLEIYGHKKQNKMTLRDLLDTGTGKSLGIGPKVLETATQAENINIQIACFLHRELPVRLAHKAIELDTFDPFRKSRHVQQVSSWYKTSFQQLIDSPAPVDLTKEKAFSRLIGDIYERHSATLITMAKGAHEIKSYLKYDTKTFSESDEVQCKLDDFYMSRIGIRILIGQYLALRNQPASDRMIGLISLKCSCHEIAREAINDAAYMCERVHGDAPQVQIRGPDLHFAQIPTHLKYILLELLKNSMRATIEKHGVDNMPPIKIIVSDGKSNEDIVIKVSDEGGGIKRSNMKRIWSYLYTTADPSVLERMLSQDSGEPSRDFDTASPLAGLGYGLPISRNYARYFGGDMQIMSMEGYGTDSFIYLPRLGDRSGEKEL